MQSSFLKLTVGLIFALTFSCVALVSEICASTASAETQSTEQEQVEKTAVDHALHEWNDAFGHGNLSAIGQHCPLRAYLLAGGQGAAYNV
jgi:hypothetical protein